MKKVFLSIVAILVAMASWAQSPKEQVESLFADWQANGKDSVTELFFARKFIGLPYVAHTLEKNYDKSASRKNYGEEVLVVNLKEFDCTTLVETVAALTLCAESGNTTYDDFKQMLKKLRYRHGALQGYTSRLHYFTDWIVDNTRLGLVKELKSPIPPFYGVQYIRVNYMSTHPSNYAALRYNPKWISVIKDTEQDINGKTFRYITKTQLANTATLRKTVKDGDIIAITSKKKGLDIAHVGFAVWHEDGLHLLNASSLHKKVVDEPMTLLQYIKQHPSFSGIRVVRLKTSQNL